MARNAQQGFTLLELMISVTLVAALATGMLMAMHNGLLSLDKTSARLDGNRRAMGIEQNLARQLAGAVTVRAGCGGQGAPFAFRGTSDTLRMVSAHSIAGAPGPHVVEYRVAPDQGGTVKLMVYERLYTGPASPGFCNGSAAIQDSQPSLVAAARLAYCRFAYRQMNPDTEFRGGGWVSTWNGPNLPAAVRIEMVAAAPDPTRLPWVAITAQLHTNRAFDDVTDDDQQQ